MDIEILRLIDAATHPGWLMLIEWIALITFILAIVAVPTYLVGITWLCIEEIRRPRNRRTKLVTEAPNPDNLELVAVLAALDDLSVDGTMTNSTGSNQIFPSRRWKPALRQMSGVPR